MRYSRINSSNRMAKTTELTTKPLLSSSTTKLSGT
jgi:hypothetical protein